MRSLMVAIRVIAEFTKTTLVGGVLVVVPVYLSLVLLLKMFGGVMRLIAPVTHGLPAALPFRQLLAIVLIIFVCLVCGLIIRTIPGRWMKEALEHSLLEKIPGYALLRGLAGRIAGRTDEQAFAVVLAEIEEALVPAFLVEDCDDENCAIFVPSVPTPAAGSLYIIAKKRVHKVDVPFTQALGVISKWGAGSRSLFAHIQYQPSQDVEPPAEA